MALRKALVVFVAAWLIVGCPATEDHAAPPSTGAGGAGGHGGGLLAAGGRPNAEEMCPSLAKLVYMVGEDRALYSFDPPSLGVTKLGRLDCPGTSQSAPFSMAIDRKGIASVLYNDGHLFHVALADLVCAATDYEPKQLGWHLFGMGFVSETKDSNEETLFVTHYDGNSLGWIDPATSKLTAIGSYEKGFGSAELTGTGDGRLFGFFSQESTVAELDKATAAVLSSSKQPVTIGAGWAFAFWGGSFYLFTGPTGMSQIDKYDPKFKTTYTVKENIGSLIVGAGVSTCAPIEPPT